jgi:hypothetical protein
MNYSQIIIIILLIFLLVLSAILIAISSKLYTINNYIKKGGMIPIDRIKEFLRNHNFNENDADGFRTYLDRVLGTNNFTDFDNMREGRVLAYQNWKAKNSPYLEMEEFLRNHKFDENDAKAFSEYLSGVLGINSFKELGDEQSKSAYEHWKAENSSSYLEKRSQSYLEKSPQPVHIERGHIGKFNKNKKSKIESSEMDEFRKYLNGEGKYLSSDFVYCVDNEEYGKCLEIYNIFKEWERDRNRSQSSLEYAIVPPPQESSSNKVSNDPIGNVSMKAITNFFREARINDDNADSFLNYVNRCGFVFYDIDFINLGSAGRMELYRLWVKESKSSPQEESKSSPQEYAIVPQQQIYNSRGEIIQTESSIDNDLNDLPIDELTTRLENAKGRIRTNYDYEYKRLPNSPTREDDEYIIQKIPEIIAQKRRSIEYFGDDRESELPSPPSLKTARDNDILNYRTIYNICRKKQTDALERYQEANGDILTTFSMKFRDYLVDNGITNDNINDIDINEYYNKYVAIYMNFSI